MSDYERTSQLCDYSQLSAILQLALLQQAEEHGCGEIPEDILMCLETISQRKEASILTSLKSRLTGLPLPGAVQQSVAIVLPDCLMWAFTHWQDDTYATVLSVRLNEAEITDYAHDQLVEDYGLNILGFSSGEMKRSLKFLGLGRGPDTDQFKQYLRQTAAKVKAV